MLKETFVKLMSTNQVEDLFEGDGKGKSGDAGFGYTFSLRLIPIPQ